MNLHDRVALQRIVGEWAAETFPDDTRDTISASIRQESQNLRQAVLNARTAPAPIDPPFNTEIARSVSTMYLLLLRLADKEGFSLHHEAILRHALHTMTTPKPATTEDQAT
jgi:hypothetical protein